MLAAKKKHQPLHKYYDMQSPRFICFILVLAGFALLLCGCGRVSTSNWIAFADSLGTGSGVSPFRIVNFRGEVDVKITKAADPEWKPGIPLEYPYAGVLMQLRRSGGCDDLSESSMVTIEYKLQGKISMRVVQKNIQAGEEHRVELPPHDEFTVERFAWNQFMQPDWVEEKRDMDLSCLTALMFTNSSEQVSRAHLVIRDIEFPD